MAVVTAATALRDTAMAKSALDDERLGPLGRAEVGYRLLVRFPLGTALFEEVVFRGVLPAALRNRPVWQAELISAGAFAVWHIIPTSAVVAANPATRSSSLGRRATLVLGGSAAAGLAGLALAGMRRASSSLAAPWLTHATVNGTAFLLALRARGS